MFRIEGSTKYGQSRWKYVQGHGDISDISTFCKGLIGYTNGCKMVDTDAIVDYAIGSRIYKPILDMHQDDRPSDMPSLDIPKDFRIRYVQGSMTVLDRIRPGYCNMCARVHDNENAYMIGNRFFCRRF
ncbi:hypothetical protein DM01DRAFT_1336655 [Hesseltinella vesiculosa]|uniref:Uncharacterized protein n=1 Tax=Hesseltinella vesiculosa TaxID=101127 RepID=A0A1X2GFZ7_9FUNG|nr:hypothetical protein DM01DRAFT_1336655 [Hesseltinella vesiculosa]